MRSIFELAPKPSDAVRAMIDGLREQSQRKDFEIHMGYFGKNLFGDTDVICCGCAATCTLQKLTSVSLTSDNISELDRISVYQMTYGEMKSFEIMIDSFRYGEVESLFAYYGVEPIRWFFFNLPHLTTNTWKAGLPRYEKLYNKLIEKGL